MSRDILKKLNRCLAKYIAAPFLIVVLIAGLTACGDESGKEHLSTIMEDENSYSSEEQSTKESDEKDTSDSTGSLTGTNQKESMTELESDNSTTDSIIESSDENSTDVSIEGSTEDSTEEGTTSEQENTTESDTEPTTKKPEPTTPESTTKKPEPTTPEPTTKKPEPTTKKPEPTTKKPEPTTAKPEPTTKKPEPVTEEPTTSAPKDYNIQLDMPSAPGKAVSDLNGYIIDYSNINDGYVMVKSTVSAEAVIQVKLGDKNGALAGQYVLKISNNYVAIPLTKGSATYNIRVMQKNPESGMYSEKNAVTVTPSIKNDRQPYRYPNVYVYYMKSSTAVKLSYQLCDGLTSDEQKVKAIHDYIVKNIKYDYNFAKTATAGYMDSERCLKNKSGICGDYSVLFATMCRAQGIPCVVIEGYVTAGGQVYHAWNQVYYNQSWHFYDTTFDAGGGTGSNYLENFRY